MKQAYLHIGVPKTGTKSIQSFLKANKERLLALGVLFPGDDKWHAEMASYFAGSSPSFAHNRYNGRMDLESNRASDAEVVRTLERELEGTEADLAVFTYEALHELSRDQLADLKAFLLRYCESVMVLFYVRDPLQWAASAYSTHARNGFPRGLELDVSSYLFPYRGFLSRFVEVFGREHCIGLSYETEREMRGDIIRSFLGTVGVSSRPLANRLEQGNLSDYFEFPQHLLNPSLSWEAIELAKELRRLVGEAYDIHSFKKYFRLISLFGSAAPTRFQLTQSEAERLLKAFAPHETYLRQTFGLAAGARSAQRQSPSAPTSVDLSLVARVMHDFLRD